jgi:hypothetical protein
VGLGDGNDALLLVSSMVVRSEVGSEPGVKSTSVVPRVVNPYSSSRGSKNAH